MYQPHIKALLAEASNPTCSLERARAIKQELIDAIHPRAPDSYAHARSSGYGILVDHLFEQMFAHRRDLIPTLFPTIAAVCGDKNHWFLADIDWSLVPQSEP